MAYIVMAKNIEKAVLKKNVIKINSEQRYSDWIHTACKEVEGACVTSRIIDNLFLLSQTMRSTQVVNLFITVPKHIVKTDIKFTKIK